MDRGLRQRDRWAATASGSRDVSGNLVGQRERLGIAWSHRDWAKGGMRDACVVARIPQTKRDPPGLHHDPWGAGGGAPADGSLPCVAASITDRTVQTSAKFCRVRACCAMDTQRLAPRVLECISPPMLAGGFLRAHCTKGARPWPGCIPKWSF
jgi:hypothetical protein